jgi:nicotinate phosphoribosyltransferase
MPIIKSLLDTDFYKFTMGQVAFHQFPTVDVGYRFKCRNQANWTRENVKRITQELQHFASLKFTEDELEYLSSLGYFKNTYIEFLRNYQPNVKHLFCGWHPNQNELEITVKGPWYSTIYWEVPLLAIVNEVYFSDTDELIINSGKDRLTNKLDFVDQHPFPFVDFGTRRRFSATWHRYVTMAAKQSPNYRGTSNVLMAKEFGVAPIGTMAHEFLQVGQAINVPLIDSQKYMLQAWMNEYRGKLGIALTDVISLDAFLKDFDFYFAKLYDGLRHDSGDPFVWADKVIAHYRESSIDPKTKSLVFSDGLDFNKASAIYTKYKDQAKISFGIGTNLTNDFAGLTPLQIVMKIVRCNGRPVAKISDSPGKGMCEDNQYVNYLRKVFNVPG